MRKIIGFFCAALMLAMPTVALAQANTNLSATDQVLIDRVDANGVGTRSAIKATQLFNGIGLGYLNGSGGGAVATQITSRTTAVAVNAFSGQITMFSAAGSATAATFTVNDSKVLATDTIEIVPSTGATNLYTIIVTAVANGSFNVTFFTTGGTATDAPVLNFAIVHAATS
jgi:hypothetical protein